MSEHKTITEKILESVTSLINNEGKVIFTRNEVRKQAGINREQWNRSYSPIFQGMRAAPSGIGAPVGEKYKNVFDRIEHGKYQLTDYGYELIENIS